jgi:hypothetical protein
MQGSGARDLLCRYLKQRYWLKRAIREYAQGTLSGAWRLAGESFGITDLLRLGIPVYEAPKE